MTLSITPEVVAEYIPCDEAHQIIKNEWDKESPGIYGNPKHFIGSYWYVEVPPYIEYLVKLGKQESARKMVRILLTEDWRSGRGDEITRAMTFHRLGRTGGLSVEELEGLL